MVIQAQAQNLNISTLHDNAFLVSFKIGLWRGIKADKRVRDAGAQAFGADAEMLNASRHLVAQDSIKKLEARRAFYRSEWARLTAPWLDDGTRIALAAGFIPLKQAVSSFEDEWNGLVADFVRQYPYLRDDARRSLGPTLFNVNDYPDPNTIADRFTFRFLAFPLPQLGDWRTAGLSQTDLDAIKANAEQALRDTIAAAQADAWARLRAPIAHMAESLRNYTGERKGSFQHTLVTNLIAVLDVLPAINLTADPTLDGIAGIARALTQYTADDLRQDETTRADTAALAEKLVAEIDAFI